MPHPPFVNSPELPYHITNRCINKEWFRQPMEEVWEIFSLQLAFVAFAFNLRVHAFVLMSNHYHLLVTTPDKNLSRAINYFQAETSKYLVKSAQRINHTWARRFKRCEISNDHYFKSVYKYLYRNPVAGGMCDDVLDYKYSSLPGLIGMKRLEFPVQDPFLIEASEDIISWLNIVPDPVATEDLRRALNRNKFSLPRYKGKKNKLEEFLY